MKAEPEYYDDKPRSHPRDFLVGDLVCHRASHVRAVVTSLDLKISHSITVKSCFGIAAQVIPEEIALLEAGPARKEQERALGLQEIANKENKEVMCSITGETFSPMSEVDNWDDVIAAREARNASH